MLSRTVWGADPEHQLSLFEFISRSQARAARSHPCQRVHEALVFFLDAQSAGSRNTVFGPCRPAPRLVFGCVITLNCFPTAASSSLQDI